MDIIFISELRIETLVGIYDWEQKIPQTVQFDLEIGIPDAGHARTDKIGETIDYAKVVVRIADGKPKLKDLPQAMGGSGETIPE